MTQEDIFKDYHDFLELKKALGFDPTPYTFYLKPFLEYCIEMYPDENRITKEMVDGWLLERRFQTNATQSHAISNLRTFSRYINSLGRQAYIPSEEYSVPVRHYQPYIFSDDELCVLFHSIDCLAPCFEAPDREFIVPVLFRMMYCCGMRPSEPLHLLTEDINLRDGDIYIRQSKMSKDRHIIMSEDMLVLCRKYDSMMGARQWFFQKWDGGPFPTYWMTNQFRICWRNSGLEKHGNPRPYDLRHCFAARTLMRWVDEGSDIMALLPYLSTYMGHKKFKHTQYYIHLLPERLRISAGINWGKLDAVFEGEDIDEN